MKSSESLIIDHADKILGIALVGLGSSGVYYSMGSPYASGLFCIFSMLIIHSSKLGREWKIHRALIKACFRCSPKEEEKHLMYLSTSFFFIYALNVDGLLKSSSELITMLGS